MDETEEGRELMPELSTMPNAALPAGLRKKAMDAVGGADMSPEDWRGLVGGLLKFFKEEAAETEHAQDAAPKTLYVNRPLKNADAILEWARKAGFKKTLPADDMHVTIAFSKTPMAWPQAENGDIVESDGTRSLKQLGDKGAVVLRFDSSKLTQRWHQFRGMGASWDWPEYQPHITITYDAEGVDWEAAEPYSGSLEFGSEQFAEVDPDAADKAKAALVGDSLTLALDESMRSVDEYGHMRVKVSNISKAQIRPYLGREIPGWNEEEKKHLLGLDPDETYNMLCPAEELAKSVPLWNGKPLLWVHEPSDAEDHPVEETIGSFYDVEFVDPYLRAALTVWRQEGIDFIESEERRQISLGYGYMPEMIPGVFKGEPYHGIMRNLTPNHGTICEEGRAGPDVMVADSIIEHQWGLIENALEDAWLS